MAEHGHRTEELEEKFARYNGSAHASRGYQLHRRSPPDLRCGGAVPGDEVILPSLTFVATAGAIRHSRGHPVFADIQGSTDPWLAAEAAEAAIGERTKAIMNMTYGGHPGGERGPAGPGGEREA